jgi:quercetin dioxygenase-like cupin family protein
MPTKLVWLVLTLLSNVALAQDAAESVVRLPDEIEYSAADAGPSMAVLYGDPTKPGVYVARVKIPAGFQLMPHIHPDEWRTAVVLSGTLFFGLGTKWNESNLRPYPAGTFFSEPKDTPHFAWARDGEVIVQVTGMGPSGSAAIPSN